MRVRRGLLVVGNDKLSAAVSHFDLPAVSTCPGRSRGLCQQACYARRGRFAFPQVRARLAWNYAQSCRDDFADRLVDEVYRKAALVVRYHVSGDFYSPGYVRKWAEVVRRSPHARFFGYTRSWRVPAIAEALWELAALANNRLWLSADAETGLPPHVPPGVRVAWLRADAGTRGARADLVFRVRALRAEPPGRFPLETVCPHETPAGRDRGTTCGTCQTCWT